jgi:uncharacterized membrane protein YphA (DoxX/SURF4 family)
MNTRTALYWTTTLLVALAMLTGGTAYLARLDAAVQALTALGYPPHFITLLGTWKILGGLAILAPGLPRLKEWAYAGIALNLIAAEFAHMAVGDPVVKMISPLVFLGLAIVSWALRPASRKLAAGQ